jgi:tellurite resistance protein TerC
LRSFKQSLNFSSPSLQPKLCVQKTTHQQHLAANKDLEPLTKESSYNIDAKKSLALFAMTCLFAGSVALVKGIPSSIEFLSGYLLEMCLSVDNLIVFILLFDTFKVQKREQDVVLTYGIIGAIILRGLFIGLGTVAISKFQSVLGVFALILFYSSFKLLFADDEEVEEVEKLSMILTHKQF